MVYEIVWDICDMLCAIFFDIYCDMIFDVVMTLVTFLPSYPCDSSDSSGSSDSSDSSDPKLFSFSQKKPFFIKAFFTRKSFSLGKISQLFSSLPKTYFPQKNIHH